jgi:hypothetical protein
MEPPGLGMRPRIQCPHDLAALVGVGAAGLRRAGVADRGAGAVADEAGGVVELDAMQELTLRALPGIG